MKYNLLGIAVAMVITTTGFADTANSGVSITQNPVLNVVHYQTSVEQWVTTKTALVTIGVDASLNQAGMDNLQQQVNDSLKTLADNVVWQMTDDERNQDSSGLEQIHIEEQARLTSDQLVSIRTKTNTLSKPGIKYSIIDLQFTPSLAEIQVAQDNLRSQLYGKIKHEIDLLDKTYDENFYVHDLEFFSGNLPAPVPMAQNQANYKAMMVSTAPQPQATMSQRLIMNADVTLASTIKDSD